MKTEQEIIERYKTLIKEIKYNDKLPKYNRRMLTRECNILHWVLFE